MNIGFDLPSGDAVLQYLANAPLDTFDLTDDQRLAIRKILHDGRKAGRSHQQIGEDIESRLGVVRELAQQIARDEIGNAYSRNSLQGAKKIQAVGILMAKSWLIADDDKTCEKCRENGAAGWILTEERFPSGHDSPLACDGCRCVLLTRRARGVMSESEIARRQKDLAKSANQSEGVLAGLRRMFSWRSTK